MGWCRQSRDRRNNEAKEVKEGEEVEKRIEVVAKGGRDDFFLVPAF
jgi:hypothetical protein